VYYAHLASNRARAHECHPSSDGPRGGQKFEELRQDTRGLVPIGGASRTGSSQQVLTEAAPLLPLGNPDSEGDLIPKLRTSMCKYSFT
jgi:eukaryotic translation initiation factor 2C